MDKRTFLKTTSILAAGTVLLPLESCVRREHKIRTNWAGNLEYSTDRIYTPETIEQLQERVANSEKARIVGTRHSFNTIADSNEAQLVLGQLNRIELDEEALTVKVGPGVTYGQLCPYLHERGYALHNLASLPHISVAGACATATHGSGVDNGNLATAISGMEFVDAAGELRTLSRENDGEKFNGAVVSLGSLGVVTRLTLEVQPAFDMNQFVYLNLPVSQLENNFEEIMSAGYSVSLFTDWQTDTVNQVWIKRRLDENGEAEAGMEPEFFGARQAEQKVHPIIENSAENCTEQRGIPGPWFERLPHFRMNFTPSSGKELQAEYFVPREHAMDAFHAISSLRSQLEPLLMISEIRTIAADDLWMSTAYRRPSVAFHFTCEQNWDELKKLLPVIEEKLKPFEGRPHWGKMFTMEPSRLESMYEKIADFRALLTEYDPGGKFRNEYIRKNIFDS